jgi:hypothetical protein
MHKADLSSSSIALLARGGEPRHIGGTTTHGVRDMRDDYLDRSWADHHFEFSDAVHKLFRSFRISMESLTAQQFDAPWQRPTRRESCPTR